MRLILLSGWRGVGKDQLGAVLCQRYGYRRYAFADVLKDHCATKFRVPRANFDHRTRKDMAITTLPTTCTPRALCIREARRLRAQNDAYFAESLVAQLQRDKPKRVVVTDWRYCVEWYSLVRAFGADNVFTVRLAWPTDARLMPVSPPSSDEVNEHQLDDFCFQLKVCAPVQGTVALAKMRTERPSFFIP